MIPESPYKGLVPFEDSGLDALLFFGRERESGIIAENLLAARLTVLSGPSGVGKTSVLRAAVARGLRQQASTNVDERGHPEFAVVVFDAWSDDPTESLREAAQAELGAQFGSALLDERPDEALAETLGRWTDALACDLLLILDQAEEYFLYHEAESGFALELPDLVTRPGLRVRALLSIRDDALSKLDRFKGRIPNLFANYLRLDHLDRRAAREAVVRPVERFNELTGESIEVEEELVEAVLDQTATGQVDLGDAGRGLAADEKSTGRIEAAYLQLVLQRIWEQERRAGSGSLGASTLSSLGGAQSIVREHSGGRCISSRLRSATWRPTSFACSSRLPGRRLRTASRTWPTTPRSTSSGSCRFSPRLGGSASFVLSTAPERTALVTRSSTTCSGRRCSPGAGSRSWSMSVVRPSGVTGAWRSSPFSRSSPLRR